MRVAEEERREEAERSGREVEVCYKWVPGSALPGEGLWEKKNSETVEMWIDSSLFVDDTMAAGHEELEGGVEVIRKVVGEFEECYNDDMEEKLVFGSEESGEIRMLGCWMGWKEDVPQRLASLRGSWWKLKRRRRRKMVCYWKKLLREAGIDWKDLKQVTSDRKEWRRIVKERMNRLDIWEKSRGHKWKGEMW